MPEQAPLYNGVTPNYAILPLDGPAMSRGNVSAATEFRPDPADPERLAELAEASGRLESATPQEILTWAVERFLFTRSFIEADAEHPIPWRKFGFTLGITLVLGATAFAFNPGGWHCSCDSSIWRRYDRCHIIPLATSGCRILGSFYNSSHGFAPNCPGIFLARFLGGAVSDW